MSFTAIGSRVQGLGVFFRDSGFRARSGKA